MEKTYEPAWGYRRHAWSVDTGLEWVHGKHGDELRLTLPPHMVAIRTHDDPAIEALAWQEARVGPLHRTWTTRPGKARYGYKVYECDPRQMQQTITTGVTIETSNIPVWPTPVEDGDRWTWYDPEGIPLLGPPEPDFSPIGAAWLEELTLTLDRPSEIRRTNDDYLRCFIGQTFVPNGHEHRLTSEEIYQVYRDWCAATELHPNMVVPKVYLGRWINESTAFHKWAGRTAAGYRRGFTGLRYPDGSWNS